NSSTECDSFRITVDITTIFFQGTGSGTDFTDNVTANIHKTVRHEIGHTFGIPHGNNDVMTSGPVPTQLQWVVMSLSNLADVNRSQSPYGVLDSVIAQSDGSFRVKGWAVDPNAAHIGYGAVASSDVHIYVDVTGYARTANSYRPDVNNVHAVGNNHGFDTVVSSGHGTHKVCVYAINVGSGLNSPANTTIGCRTLTS
ncbi:MAG: hypothetical protein WBF71_16945, partial [Microthrixaceae bacterium]